MHAYKGYQLTCQEQSLLQDSSCAIYIYIYMFLLFISYCFISYCWLSLVTERISIKYQKTPKLSEILGKYYNGGNNIGWACFFRSLNWLVLLYMSIMHKLWIIIIKTINKKTLTCPNYEGRLKIWNRTSVSARLVL